MIVEHRGAAPIIDSSATIAASAIVSGDVAVGPGTVVLAGAVITSEGAPVRIGERCVLMENAVVRGAGIHPCAIGDHVLVGPHVHISGARIGRCCFIATGATLLNGCVIGEGSVVGIHAVVHIATHCLPSTFIPIGHIAVGSPAKIHPPQEAPAVHAQISALGFTRIVFGFDSSSMTNLEATRELCDRYTLALGRHRNDQIIER